MSLNLSESFASMGSGGHHIYGHGSHELGKITEHGHVMDRAGRKIGSIDHEGIIRDRAHHKVGRIGEDGKIYNKWSSHAQISSSDGHIHDQSGKRIGHAADGTLGGAAMLLMLNKEH